MTTDAAQPEAEVLAEVAQLAADIESIEVPFLRDVVAALVISGHDIEVDSERLTVEVQAAGPWLQRLLCIVRPLARGVTCYAIGPEPAPAEVMSSASDLAVRASARELDVCFDLDQATGTFAARASVTLGAADVTLESLALLLTDSLDRAEQALTRHRVAVASVWTGGPVSLPSSAPIPD